MTALIPFIKRSTLNDWVCDIDRIFEPLANTPYEGRMLSISGDIEEDEQKIVMSFDLPGLKEGEFSVKIQENRLTLSGERKKEVKPESEKNSYVYYGREFGKFNKVFTLPKTVDKSKVTAEYKDGVLTIALPKQEPEAENVIDVKIK
ncbi:MAG: Hsp20/alpha crystallin family protein [Bdellovibrionales bacterium]|nr:Hsp20/alpha crystallin family protein [Bdellovibrionales bacterium]